MKYYAQFYESCGPNKTEMLGSEAVFILDGRKNLHNMVNDARERLKKLRNVHKRIAAFTICKGERFDKSHIIYDSNPELLITKF